MNARSRGRLVRRALFAADLTGLAAAFALSQLLVGPARVVGGAHDSLFDLAIFFGCLPLWIVAAKLAGLYAHDEQRATYSTADDFIPVLNLLTFGTWILYAGTSLTHFTGPHLGVYVLFWISSVSLVTGFRSLARVICRRRPAYVQNTVIVGAGNVGQMMATKILRHPEYGIRLLGFVDAVPRDRGEGLGGLPVIGELDDLPEVIRRLRVDRVIVAFSMESHGRMLKLLRALNQFEVHVDVVPRLFELVPPTADIYTLEGTALIGLPALRLSRSSLLLKRAMDLLLAGVGLVLLAPLLLAIAALVKLDSPGPAVFRQIRQGRTREFVMLKFRTMSEDAELQKHRLASMNRHANGGGDPRMFKIPDDPRATRFGAFLRRYSLDELPQLWNVLKGDMSFVGPRPLIPEEHRHVDGWANRRLDLKPGITGLWQVSGRDAMPFGEMVRLDYFYVTTWSLWNDILLLLRTVPAVVQGERPFLIR